MFSLHGIVKKEEHWWFTLY